MAKILLYAPAAISATSSSSLVLESRYFPSFAHVVQLLAFELSRGSLVSSAGLHVGSL